MEQVYLTIAIVAFVLAGCSAITCLVIFFKMKVADAIRFLLRKPASDSTLSVLYCAITEGISKAFKGFGFGRKARHVPDAGTTSETASMNNISKVGVDDSAFNSAPNVELTFSGRANSPMVASSDNEGELLLKPSANDDNSECPTSFLSDNDDSEHPTSFLNEDESERPTNLLFDDEGSECPTAVLEEHRQLELLANSEQESGKYFESSFCFVLRQNIVEIHTDEKIV